LKPKNNYKARYFPFIEGELIDLCIPNEKAIWDDAWADWFNNTSELQATQHGIFPNYRSTQESILSSLATDRSKIVLLICAKNSHIAIGVVSLQNINFQSKSAEIAINTSSPNKRNAHPFFSLEAMALIAQHGFEEVGLTRISGGQVYPALKSWNKMIELIGFKSEGVLKKSFVRGQKIQDIVCISCLHNDYLAIKKIRGSLWGSYNLIKGTMKRQPKIPFADVLSNKLVELEKDHFRFLFEE
jgi:RimJ/RimL family protein N-acetyltransferase